MMHVLYGGTFDPVHNGHMTIANTVAATLAQCVWLVPSADPPHRLAPGASAEQRAVMLDLAVIDRPQLRVDRRELRRLGPSFTIDTLREVRREIGPAVPLVWVLGLDAMVQLNLWKQWRSLFEFAHVFAVQRPGTDVGLLWLAQQSPEVAAEVSRRHGSPSDFGKTAYGRYADFAIHPIRTESASAVRACLASDAPISGPTWQSMVPTAVADYICQNRLYSAAERR